MQFLNFHSLAVAVLAVSAVGASPTSEHQNSKRNDGECNGTSCNLNPGGLIPSNYECTIGSCVGSGGGDGAFCKSVGTTNDILCPVNCGDRCPQ
ncbi:hypothetical protein J7T55_001257 [Diaporthe amygdali]|uniref:uncharacterized protein n=1 Tax=Phomopsis amygdali TaxID=1214568 RepID=UPI0022FF0C15|nr:uncharacterized protein J7T55_001257 [Diaporthe amygdali]KAJ0103886.1 hypothetical protein J7T55_001257 [Diaporthe amygdali]